MSNLPATYLTIDPGSIGIGYAIWSNAQQYPIYTGCLELKSGSFQERLELLINAFDFLIKDIAPVHVYCEEPHYFDTHTGYKSAKREDFTKLVTSYGAIFATCILKHCTWHPVSIAKWKGQAPKEVIHARIKRTLPEKDYKDHEADAVGIGLYLRGWK